MQTNAAVKTVINPNKALWEKGDFTRLAATMRESGEELVSRLGITSNMRVLDLGCGDGTTAIPVARLGAQVTGVDIASNLVRAGIIRAFHEGLQNIRFEEGDAADLSRLPDGHFDLVLTVFGAMFASRPFDVAKEMVRVTRPGGRIIMGNWIPGDPTLVAQVLRISSAYTMAPPPGFVSPMLWGDETNVLERFAAAGIEGSRVSFQRETYTFHFNGSPQEFVDTFRRYYGPTMNAFDAAQLNGKAKQLQNELNDLFERQNISGSSSRTIIPATYLRVTVNL